MRLVLATAAIVLLASPVIAGSADSSSVAQESQAEPQPSDEVRTPAKQEEQKVANEPKKICKRVQAVGSRRTEKVCLTKEQWNASGM